MPDPTKQTISATQAPALFNVSPYFTRWMLNRHFAIGLDIESEPNTRMKWGSLMQPLLLQQAAADMKFEVIPNAADVYHRRGQLGCTRDATIICPDRGPGALETKCVFDYRTWMQDWGGGKFAPKHYEIQLQQQMLVGDGTTPYQWGVLSPWVAGEQHYFERKPIPDLWNKLEIEAKRFFWEISEEFEPDPFGAPMEIPWLTELFPCVRGKQVDMTGDHVLGEIAIQYRDAKAQEAAGARTAEPLRAKILAAAKDAEDLLLPDGLKVRVRPHGKGKSIKVFDPISIADLMMAG